MYDLIIVGSGPAGMTAAIYASRAGLKTLIVEKGAPGGKMFLTHQIDNYPGYEMITGRELSSIMHKHALAFGAEFEYGNVEEIINIDNFHKKVITNMKEYETKTVIIATGTENKKLGVKGEDEFLGKGVSYCAVCDGNFFRNKDVAVVGGGNSAFEEALYLADICKSVTIIHRREEFRAEAYTIKKVKAKDNIRFELNSEVEEIIGDNVVNIVRIINNKTKESKDLEVSGIFIYVGLKPITNVVQDPKILDDYKNIKADKNMRTVIKGIYGAGDVNAKDLRQISTAINDGAISAQSVIEDLK